MAVKGRFVLTGSASSKAVEAATKKGGAKNSFKMTGTSAKLLIVGPIKENEPVFGTNITHTHFNGKGEFICGCASKQAFGGKDRIAELGWKVRNKFKDSDNEKKKNLFKRFLPKTNYCLNVIDLNDIEGGVKRWESVPNAVMEVVFEEIKDLDNDLTTICDFQKGRPLLVKTNGKEKLNKRYRAQFKESEVNLDLSDEDMDKLFSQTKSVTDAQKPFDEQDEAKVYDYAITLLEKLGVSMDDDEDTEDDEDLEESEESETEEEDEIEEEKAPVKKEVKKAAKPATKSKPSDFDEEDLEEDITDTEDEEEEDFEEEEEAPAPKKKSAVRK